MARNNKEKNKPVIGMDFGNCYSFLSYISDFDCFYLSAWQSAAVLAQ